MPGTGDNAYLSPNPGPLGRQAFGSSWNANIKTEPFTLISEDGLSKYWLWVDSTGRLRISTVNVAPASDTAGTVVGTQA